MKATDREYAEKIIKDVHFACLTTHLRTISKNRDPQVLKKDIIIKCNNDKLHEFGMRIEDAKITILPQ